MKELKAAGLLVDLNKRHSNRCKIYKIPPLLGEGDFGLPKSGEGLIVNEKPSPDFSEEKSPSPKRRGQLTPEAKWQWHLYEKTFRIVFKMPNLEQLYAQVTWDLEGVQEEKELWTKTFAGLWAITGDVATEKVFDPQRNSWFYRRKEL